MKRIILVAVMIGSLFVNQSFAAKPDTQVDALIRKLVEKGVLTDSEATQIKDEIVSDEKVIREDNMKKDIPQWVQDMKLQGDFRLRHEWSKRNDSSDQYRSRGRIRYRLGIETKINDTTKVALGLASNGGNSRSPNQTFTDTFAKSAINLDYAFAQWSPRVDGSIVLTGGKMKISFWEPSDLLWDTDLTPEGGAANLRMKINDNLKVFTNLGAFVLLESAADQTDPFSYVLQPGIELKLGEKSDLKTVFTYYGFSHGANKSVLSNRSSPTTNTVVGGKYSYKYDAFSGGAEIGFNDPFGENFPVYIPRIGLIGQYIHNPDADDEGSGWIAGSYIGNSKVSGKGQWKATMTYRSLGRDAWLDVLPDSDFYGGATDVRGYEGILELGLTKNVILALDYYRAERLSSVTTKAPESVLQTDLNFKF